MVSVLALFAHPDDAEFLCAGTLVHLADRGAKIHIATLTAGDCGSAFVPPAKITSIRRGEAQRAAKMIGATYTCLEEKDLSVFYDRRTLQKVMELVRRVNPSLVFSHSPSDYMVDHEMVSRLAQMACFGSTAPNYRTRQRGTSGAAKPLRSMPHLYYAEPFGGRDILGNEVQSSVFVDVSATLERKEKMLACHESQQAWLRAQQGISETSGMVQRMAERAGQHSGFRWAEGFRQHLGQGFPQDNLLTAFLSSLAKSVGAAGIEISSERGTG